MTQPSLNAQEQMVALRAAYPTPEFVAERLGQELGELEATIRAAQAHWHTPMPGREWTPAQEAEHAVLVNEGSGKLARLLLSDKPIRQPPEVYGVLRDGRRVAPPGTEPVGDQTPEALLARSAATRELLTVHAPANPERTYFHPYMGQIDALDWLRMAAYHTRHHRKAMERGLAALSASS
ncbi:DinB family protein [Deinococcus koreensis]|uniref:DinB family protein n=1 Tax=Deinococcus koreensis TaxID=2054903 RepID=A0A2K3V2D9_9DEIO|nr:DinB family protein [Deinococcus koreensis]PNY82952.1 DinB family protein [Deinococcus koreensis]